MFKQLKYVMTKVRGASTGYHHTNIMAVLLNVRDHVEKRLQDSDCIHKVVQDHL